MNKLSVSVDGHCLTSLIDEAGKHVASCNYMWASNPDDYFEQNKAVASRLAKCHNACVGMEDPAGDIVALKGRVAALERKAERLTAACELAVKSQRLTLGQRDAVVAALEYEKKEVA